VRLLLLLVAIPLAQDVFVPPVPKGIARDGVRVQAPAREILFPSEDATWIRVRSERFDILSNTSEMRTRDLIADVETLAAALMQFSDRFAPSRNRATVFVFDRRRDSQPFFDLLIAQENATPAGAYARFEGGGVMIIDGSRKGRVRARDPGIRTAMHELIHDLLRQSESAPPLWLEEGLAEYFSNARVQSGRVSAGDPIRSHEFLLQRRAPMSLERLLAVQAGSSDGASTQFYAASWAAVNFLIGIDSRAFFAFLRDIEANVPVADALQLHYQKTLKELESAIRWRTLVSKSIILPVPRPAPQAAAEPVDRATLLFELGTMLSHIAGAEAEAQRFYREALRVDPRHARSLVAVGEFEAALTAAPEDAEVHLLYAETLLTTALGPFAGIFEPKAADAENFRKARALAERALVLDGSEGIANGIIGTTYLVESDFAPGIVALERARTLLPQRMDFALNLYAMYLRSGERTHADMLFAAAFENARDKQTIFAARSTLVVCETKRANTLALSGRIEEAAAVVRELAATTPDGNGRRKLEEHAEKLDVTLEVNRQIAKYNEAIVLANQGRNGDAIGILDELLKTATDAQVVTNITRLRADLKKRL
jgi:tetratricopeptide (TPR) repeat protein